MNELNTFLKANNPDMQSELARSPFKCYMANYPALSELRANYGDNAPIMWLIPQLVNLSEYCGCKDKMDKIKLKQCAEIISTEFFYLKTSELMLFFHYFKSGKYGEFYGNVDPIKITSALRRFLADRNAFIDKVEQEKRDKERMKAREGAISYEEYVKYYKGKI